MLTGLLLGLWLPIGALQAQTVPLTTQGDHVEFTLDDRGNRIPDYSYCGYLHGEADIPDLAVRVRVSPVDGDNAPRIQRALDYVASLQPDANGLRGAVLLDPGTYTLDQALRINASGIALRGASRDSTILLKRGYDRGAIIYVEGVNDYRVTDTLLVASAYVPIGTTSLQVSGPDGSGSPGPLLQSGAHVTLVRPSTAAWIEAMDCKTFGGGVSSLGWKAGDVDLRWDRTVVAVDGQEVTLDAPLPLALDQEDGQCLLLTYSWPGRISHVGVENLTLMADVDPSRPFDENHAWTGVSLDNAEHAWVRRIQFRHLAGSAVIAQRGASCVTVEDCAALEPVSEVAGMRRRAFHTLGQHILFQRCYADRAIHAFSAGWTAAGPNAFVQCEAHEALGYSGSVGALSPGLLFDVVDIDGHDLVLANLGLDKNGAGWNTAGSLLWQCTAAQLTCDSPAAAAPNYAYGCWGQFAGSGPWAQSNNHVYPRSLYQAQLTQRLTDRFSAGEGTDAPISAKSSEKDAVKGDGKGDEEATTAQAEATEASLKALTASITKRCRVLPRGTKASSSPTVEVAMRLAKEAYEPLLTLERWIANAPFTASVSVEKVKSIDEIKLKATGKKGTKASTGASGGAEAQPLTYAIEGGYLVADHALLAGKRQKVRWWSGNIRPSYLAKAEIHLTRFVPDMEGTGLTDRVDSVLAEMKRTHTLVLDHNYGLWYDRRRDDHERIRRRDADVWPPHYEQPYDRSGQGRAWDGMSQYDLTRPNAWYWGRLAEFATKAESEGLLLFHHHYFQHNIIEAGAHWVDCPWRMANNVNATGFPEPVNFAGDKRVFVADMFYDVDHPTRRSLHRDYIRQCLSAMADRGNVVHLLSEEYTGPLHFARFWLDCILEWEQETGRHPLIALSTTRDVQDSILADPVRSRAIDLIDIHYWHYREGDTPYTPAGGVNLAPRQHARLVKPGRMGYAEAYRAVLEYRLRYPDKAVTLSAQNYQDHGWAVLMAGGSCPVLPVTDEAFLAAVPLMKPVLTAADEATALTGTDGATALTTTDDAASHPADDAAATAARLATAPCQLLQGENGVVAYFREQGTLGKEQTAQATSQAESASSSVDITSSSAPSATTQTSVTLTLTPGQYALHYIDPTTGELTLLQKRVKLPESYILEAPRTGVYWLEKL